MLATKEKPIKTTKDNPIKIRNIILKENLQAKVFKCLGRLDQEKMWIPGQVFQASKAMQFTNKCPENIQTSIKMA